jgi:hypothetical protein
VTISIAELTEKFGPVLVSEVYVECLVIPGDEFDLDWEAELSDMGFMCVYLNFGGGPVVLVPLKKSVPPLKLAVSGEAILPLEAS